MGRHALVLRVGALVPRPRLLLVHAWSVSRAMTQLPPSSHDPAGYRLVDPFHVERDAVTHVKPKYISNDLHTSKYNWINFLPLCLLQEFRQAANIYFLVIAVLQSISEISPLTPVTAIAPLVMVITVSLMREAIDDQAKRVWDRNMNTQPVTVVRGAQEQRIMCGAIEVGDILRVFEKEQIPADGILLFSSEDDGSCFIDTSNLDGEANLKNREALKATQSFKTHPPDDQNRFFIQCEQPDQDLYRFSGNITIGAKTISLSEKQFLLRGSTLMNTKWIQMLVAYTGHDTKMAKNIREARHKMSHVDLLMSRTVVFVFILEVTLCAIAAIAHHVRYYLGNARPMPYLETIEPSIASSMLLFLSFIVLMNTLIPISLVVTIAIVKGIHARFISWDEAMKLDTGEGASANTASLTDELGQVKFIFTDKTGTLTQNRMEFRKCSVDGNVYVMPSEKESTMRVTSISSLTREATSKPNLVSRRSNHSSGAADFSNERSVACFRTQIRNTNAKESRLALAMALCHTVVCERTEGSTEIRYNSDSPDECALVRGAITMGVQLLDRNGQMLQVVLTDEAPMPIAATAGAAAATKQKTLTYEILRVLHFTSDRKRMSIILRDASGQIKLLCKGADSVILDRCEKFLSEMMVTMGHVNQFASEGLRILLLAERILEESYYESWEMRYHKAELDMYSKDSCTEALIEEIERKLTLIGASAVEDKLQEGVPETISLFHKADVKIWVLTGDKLETSVEMGKLCRVVTPGMQEVIVRGSSSEEMSLHLDAALTESTVRAKTKASISALACGCGSQQALIIDGSSLTYALTASNREAFLRVALLSSTVIVCRSSPLQKAQVVELVKGGVPCVTLAVGDGANDVSMIRAAHVGVGVAGQEGMQAVRSADYAVQQFSHLGRLVLFHGRLSYLRTAQCINYFFYKNIVVTLPQFIFGAYSAFSGQTVFCDLYITAYNVAFTAIPVIVRATLETDLPDTMAEQFPELYRLGANDEYLSRTTMIKSWLIAIYQAVVLTLVPMACFQGGPCLSSNGMDGGLWVGSVATFFYIVPTVHLQICLETWHWTKLGALAYLASITFFVLSIALYDRATGSVAGVWSVLISTPLFWLTFALCIAMCLIPWLALQCYVENFAPTNPVHVLRRARLFNKIMDSSSIDKVDEISGPKPATPTSLRRPAG